MRNETQIREEIEGFRSLTTAQLKEKYREVFGAQPRLNHRQLQFRSGLKERQPAGATCVPPSGPDIRLARTGPGVGAVEGGTERTVLPKLYLVLWLLVRFVRIAKDEIKLCWAAVDNETGW